MAVTPSNALFASRLEMYHTTNRGDPRDKQYYAMFQNETYLEWLRGGVQ